MKKWMICILTLCLMLCGCEAAPEQTVPERVPETTATPTLLEQGMPWNGDRAVLELPLELPGATGELQLKGFGGNLLFWQTEYAEDRVSGIRFWLVEPEYGTILAKQWIETEEWLQPQIQENRICLCSSESGTVMVLDEALEIRNQWFLEPDWGYWALGHGSKLYMFLDNMILERDMDTGEERVVLEGASGVYASQLRSEGAEIWYTESGVQKVGFLDYGTGAVEAQPFRGLYDDADVLGDVWLCRKFIGGEYRLVTGDDAWDLEVPEGTLSLTEQGLLLAESGELLQLFDREGKSLGSCSLTREGYWVNVMDPVWSDSLEGFLLLAADWEYTHVKLLFWNPQRGVAGADLTKEPVDLTLTVEEELAQLREKADGLEQAYDLNIRIGTDCETEFPDFTAEHLTEPDYVKRQLEVLESVLGAFPQGFFRQLRYENYEYIEIQLVSGLTALPHYGTGGGYAGFVQPRDDCYLMVVDGYYSNEGTYFHEFSHIIDSFLEWDSWMREDARFSFEEWDGLNPEEFEYGWDYAREPMLTAEWEPYFIDGYAAINPTEDRARIFEYACTEGSDWILEQKPGVVEKLRYYALCIRDAFDTASWPEELIWEQYL